MRRLIGLLLVGAMLTACSSSSSPEPPPPAVQTPGPAPVSPPTDPAPKPDPAQVSALNDRSYLFTKAANWAEAERTAREALALDPKSSAAWYNLGKAQMGAGSYGEATKSFNKASELTNRTNVDIQYNLAKALYLQGDLESSLHEASYGVSRFPTDPDFPKLLTQVQADLPGKLLLEIDIDRDGDLEAVLETKAGIQVRDSQGTVLYQGQKLGSLVSYVRPLTMPDGTIIVHAEWAACPTYPQNELLWYNPATKQIQNAAPKDMCTTYDYAGKGAFTSWYRTHPIATAEVRRWEQGALVSVSSHQVLYGDVHQEQLPWVLSIVASSKDEVRDAQRLFATPELYQQFRAETSGQHWGFTWASKQDPSRLHVMQGENALGSITIALDQGGVITALSWPPAP